MSDRVAFLEAVQARPDDDLPRLAYADFLDDYGTDADRVRAELIRVQCALATQPTDELARRQDELLDALSLTWPVSLLADWVPSDLLPNEQGPFDQYRRHFKRGFLTQLIPDAAEFVARVGRYQAAGEPLFDLILWHWPRPDQPPLGEWLPPLIGSPDLRVVQAVGGRLPSEVFASPHLSRLSVAVLPGAVALRRLAASPSPFTLRKLSLLVDAAEPFDPAELAGLLAESPRLASLKSLSLDLPEFRGPHLRALIASPHLSPTLALTLCDAVRPHRRSAEARAVKARFPGPAAVG